MFNKSLQSRVLGWSTKSKVQGILRSGSTSAEGEYTQIPIYPKILDFSLKAKKEHERQAVHDKYKRLNTVEEKLFAINLPKYYGWNSLILKEGMFPYNFLPFVQRITRTNVVYTDKASFFKILDIHSEEVEELVQGLRPLLQELLLFELKGRRRRHELDGSGCKLSSEANTDIVCSSIVQQINGTLLSSLSSTHPHLLESVVDYEPQLEAFWAVGGFCPSDEVYNERKENDEILEEEKEEPVEHWIQYFGKPIIQLRNSDPLKEMKLDYLGEETKTLNHDTLLELPDPKVAYGIEFQRRHGTNIPGFWPGDNCEFGLLSFHPAGHLIDRPPHFGVDEFKSTLDCQAILAGFSWTHAQANYQGFSTFNEICYPFLAQTIITDGRQFSFYLYQLNTTLFHSNHINNNSRINMCVGFQPAPLYQEINRNEFVGWNDEVLASIISFYLNIPIKKANSEMKPNVHPTERLIADMEDEERRMWYHKQFRHMYSNRPRHRLPYEIYDWERIYKIKFETRPMEARSRPFERDENPLEDRKYYDHMPPYIPKKFRPKKKHWRGWRSYFEKKFYPDI